VVLVMLGAALAAWCRKRAVNDEQPQRGGLLRQELARWGSGRRPGLTYKPDVDDVRESPAVEVVRLLAREARGWRV
jgi:UDP-glucose 6-dehydrogenase